MTTVHDFTVTTADGGEVSLAKYAGSHLVIVNTASKCGLTPQYEGLEALYRQTRDLGVEVLAFPCNQFRGQEPGTDHEIQTQKPSVERESGSGRLVVRFPSALRILPSERAEVAGRRDLGVDGHGASWRSSGLR